MQWKSGFSNGWLSAGAVIYFIDALDDLEDDCKEGGFNPVSPQISGQRRTLRPDKRTDFQYGRELLNITAAELAAAYELLELKRFKGILDNIVYLGLPASMERVFNGRKNKESEPKEDLSPVFGQPDINFFTAQPAIGGKYA